MSDDLLAKEKEFHRLNRQLQLRTRDVLKEVDSIMHTHASSNSCNHVNRLYSNLMINSTKMTCTEETAKLTGQSKTIKSPDVVPIESIGNAKVSLKKDNTLGNKAIINLLKGKIDMLHKELQATQVEFNRKVTR